MNHSHPIPLSINALHINLPKPTKCSYTASSWVAMGIAVALPTDILANEVEAKQLLPRGDTRAVKHCTNDDCTVSRLNASSFANGKCCNYQYISAYSASVSGCSVSDIGIDICFRTMFSG